MESETIVTKEAVLALIERGFYVFPCREKKPVVKWLQEATNDPVRIDGRWPGPWNIGISGAKFGNGSSKLLVLDLDFYKSEGRESWKKIRTRFDLPVTYRQQSPRGGFHIIYWTRYSVRNRQGWYPGIDVRGSGGYVLGAGSIGYTAVSAPEGDTPVVEAPESLVRAIGLRDNRPARVVQNRKTSLSNETLSHLVQWLNEREPAIEGAGGDNWTYETCLYLRDAGASENEILALLVSSGWVARCQPPWSMDELMQKVKNAFRYGKEEPIPDAFEPVDSVMDTHEVLNLQFAWVQIGGKSVVVHETTNAKGAPCRAFLEEKTFYRLCGPLFREEGTKKAKEWLVHPLRRTYRGAVFYPGDLNSTEFLNLWPGWPYHLPTHENGGAEIEWAVKAWFEHLEKRIAGGDETLANWIKDWFAHLVQRPEDRPRVSLVLRGPQGVGKSTWLECFGRILGQGYLSVSSPRYLLSSFNSHLETTLLLVFEETFWAGSKEAKHLLKDLITRDRHVIERKFLEPYSVDSYLRVAIIGNEKWLVPAELDARRFACFEVDTGKQHSTAYWGRMRKALIDNNGCRWLWKALMDRTITNEFNIPPQTKMLLEQKENSLEFLHEFWLECLREGAFPQSPAWPETVRASTLKHVFGEYCRARSIRSVIPPGEILAKQIREVCPEMVLGRDETDTRVWYIPPLKRCRQSWLELTGIEL